MVQSSQEIQGLAAQSQRHDYPMEVSFGAGPLGASSKAPSEYRRTHELLEGPWMLRALTLPTVRVFISYSHQDRAYGAQVKTFLSEVGIEAFLAHEDLDVSDEWRERIIDELSRCDAFVPLLSASFLTSNWAPQEVGYIVSRPDVAVAPLSIDGTTPVGFLSKFQSRRIPKEGITREFLLVPLARRIPRKILPYLIRSAAEVHSFRSAEAAMAPLVSLFPFFTAEEAETLARAAVKNRQIWSATLCRDEYLPEFLRFQEPKLNPDTLRALRYQLKHQQRAPEPSTEPWSEDCGRLLAVARERIAMTQSELANRVECDARSLRRWETGDSTPTLRAKVRLLAALGGESAPLWEDDDLRPLAAALKHGSR